MMAMDECVPSTSEHGVAAGAMQRTHRWAERSLVARGEAPQALFGIVQGACFEDLRRESADYLTRLPFDGFAIGGLAVGEGKIERERFTALAAALLPRDLPRTSWASARRSTS
jgi:queuine tRNA-ribosyltransferase